MILDKLKRWAITEPIEDDVEYDDPNYVEIDGNSDFEMEEPETTSVPQPEPEPRPWAKPMGSNMNAELNMRNNKGNVVPMPGINNIAEVVVVEPHSFDEMPQVIQTLRERKSVVLNLNVMEPEEAQRAVDFVAGGTYAIDGHQERIGESIFLFTPNCVKVSNLSGTVHDVPEIPVNPSRNPSPVANWGAEVNRLVQ
ncbi:unknown [Crocosphaera subtropica ATCC 51142]|uniref:Cell division protein SepF n=1 Tax=Crocosphaera subtropica (strain ATCC 51142 / BH68) TaxID=43989 RepID=B1WT40_CROS5|nr:cell division protein SepF [Crocosphaera subtropica]ACB51962.1 unknown [Crocosphaera subtropica ATCC 51142]